MGILKDIEKESMTKEKKEQAKNDIFAYYIGRPLSYVLTVPFLKLKVKPNVVSLISIFPSIIGFLFIGFGETLTQKILGWIMFFLWNLLDGVDGNIARYTKQFSKTGSLWDATSGYIAMFLSFQAMGTGCYYGDFSCLNIDKAIMITLGGLSSVLVIFPRLVMHKRITSIGKDEHTEEMKNKSKYNLIKVIGLNLISIAGFVQVLMLIAILTKCMDIFTIVYFVINLIICIVSVAKLLKE